MSDKAMKIISSVPAENSYWLESDAKMIAGQNPEWKSSTFTTM